MSVGLNEKLTAERQPRGRRAVFAPVLRRLPHCDTAVLNRLRLGKLGSWRSLAEHYLCSN